MIAPSSRSTDVPDHHWAGDGGRGDPGERPLIRLTGSVPTSFGHPGGAPGSKWQEETYWQRLRGNPPLRWSASCEATITSPWVEGAWTCPRTASVVLSDGTFVCRSNRHARFADRSSYWEWGAHNYYNRTELYTTGRYENGRGPDPWFRTRHRHPRFLWAWEQWWEQVSPEMYVACLGGRSCDWPDCCEQARWWTLQAYDTSDGDGWYGFLCETHLDQRAPDGLPYWSDPLRELLAAFDGRTWVGLDLPHGLTAPDPTHVLVW